MSNASEVYASRGSSQPVPYETGWLP
jgi:hypothetical protein